MDYIVHGVANSRTQLSDFHFLFSVARACILLVVQPLSCVQLSATPWTTAYQASLSFTIYQSLLKLLSIELVMPSNRLTVCHPLLLALNLSQNQGLF